MKNGKSFLKVDLGCGKSKRKGFIGIDQFKGKDVDLVTDLNKKIPLRNNSVNILYTSHFLEHVASLEKIVEEIYRVCIPNAKVIIRVPHFSGRSAFIEFHKRFFRYDSFEDFEQKDKDMFTSKKCKFKIEKRRIVFLKKYYLPWNYFLEPLVNLHKKLCLFYEETFLRNLFPAYEVYFELRVLK